MFLCGKSDCKINTARKLCAQCCNNKEYIEVIHAHWIQKYPNSEHPDIMYCSHCNFYLEDNINTVEFTYKFCPNCSAVMDEEV